MTPDIKKKSLVFVLILPLLALIGITLGKSSSHQPPAATAPSHVLANVSSAAKTDAATAAAVHQLKQQGSYDSLQAAFRAARRQAEPVRNAPADIANASYTMSAPARGVHAYFGADAIQVRPTQQGSQAWRWDARLVGYGYGENQQAIERADPVAQNNSVEYRRVEPPVGLVEDLSGLLDGVAAAVEGGA